ncbi:hypothetical protein BJ875DRAFT_491877 [Amylocarpus encephaloides]|uniref:Uncharacterized protein n=1 Tax=Amylocarpus encephaloides TaxID=45428 RepID=A0A9P7YSP6_9HELO|nr:hypothetical protein BJ875DRAFT_491877 [Amylocarpus encephaloides]
MPPSEPTTPVRVPKSITTYTPTTQDPDLRSSINMVLLREGHVPKISETLLHALNTSSTNWPTLIQNHALTLLRSGDVHTFPELMTRVLDDIRADSIVARKAEEKGASTNGEKKDGGTKEKGRGGNGESLALPKGVVDEGVRITRECLELVCEVDGV